MTDKSNKINDSTKLLKDWYVRIRIAQRGHYQDASQLKRKNHFLGIPVVILATVVGAGVFTSIETNPSLYTQITTGLLSLLAAILASLQTFLNYSEKSEKHLNAARRLTGLKKEIEEILTVYKDNEEKIVESVSYIRNTWEEITNTAPLISDKHFEKFFREMSGRWWRRLLSCSAM